MFLINRKEAPENTNLDWVWRITDMKFAYAELDIFYF